MRQQMMDWLRNQKRTYGNFSYILVPEYQKDGTIHFHAFLKGYGGSIKRAINPNTGLPLRNTYNLTGYTHGFTKVSYISQTKDSMSKLACYLTKYVKKELLDHENQKRYWASKDLIKPNVKNNPEKWYEENEPDWQIETENGRVMRFYTGKNPEIDSFIKENAP
jgi:hypothetical protein